MQDQDIINRFSYHPAKTPEKQQAHALVRSKCEDLAHALNRLLPNGAEKLKAINRLEEVMFWANAAVARPQYWLEDE